MKTKGYNPEHNSGHGEQHLANVLATPKLLAFACRAVCDLGDKAWPAARLKLITRRDFFQTMLALTRYLAFPSRDHLLGTMAFPGPPPLAP